MWCKYQSNSTGKCRVVIIVYGGRDIDGTGAPLHGRDERRAEKEHGYKKGDFVRRFSHEAHLRFTYLCVSIRTEKPTLAVTDPLSGPPRRKVLLYRICFDCSATAVFVKHFLVLKSGLC